MKKDLLVCTVLYINSTFHGVQQTGLLGCALLQSTLSTFMQEVDKQNGVDTLALRILFSICGSGPNPERISSKAPKVVNKKQAEYSY